MKFRTLIMSIELSPIDVMKCKEICSRWENFSNLVGRMSKMDIMKMLKYLSEHRPHSKTLGQRAIQRFNALNKARWEDLINGVDRKEG